MGNGGLVITRKHGEKIIIETPQGSIDIMVHRIRGLTKLSVTAPKALRVWRGEVWQVMNKTTPEKGEA